MLTRNACDSEALPAPIALHIESGPSAHAPVPLRPGTTIQVGRSSRASVTLPNDSFLSGVHFEVAFDGETCTLRDLGSSNGTLLRDTRIAAAPLAPGDRFVAGQTVFVLLKAEPERQEATNSAEILPLEQAAKLRLLHELRTSCQPLYAVLDAAQDPRILGLLTQAKCEYALLFDQQTAPELLPFAPYLAFLPADSPMLETLLDLGWTQSWGIFLAAGVSGTELLQRLRGLLVADLPDGRECLFRFYDPRVLRTIFANPTEPQAEAFFSGVRWYLLPGKEPQTADAFTRGARGVERTKLVLDDETAVSPAITKVKAASQSASTIHTGSGPTARTRLTEAQASPA